MEFYRFYSGKDLRSLAKSHASKLHLPADYQLSHELLRSVDREHCKLEDVKGTLQPEYHVCCCLWCCCCCCDP